jgi:hypothetical protein
MDLKKPSMSSSVECDTMNGNDGSKLGKLWLLISKFSIAQREVEMTKMWKKCVLNQEDRRSNIGICKILGQPNGTCQRTVPNI